MRPYEPLGHHSSTTGSLLDEIEGHAQGRVPRVGESLARWVPTVHKVLDPREDLEDVVKLLDAGEVPELRPSYLMQRLKQQGRVDETESGVAMFEGRPCCFRTIIAVQGRLHLVKLPYPFTCETCGTTYELSGEMR